MPVFRQRAFQAARSLGRQILMYHSALTVFLSLSGTQVTYPDLAKEIGVHLLGSASRYIEFHRWALTREKPD